MKVGKVQGTVGRSASAVEVHIECKEIKYEYIKIQGVGPDLRMSYTALAVALWGLWGLWLK